MTNLALATQPAVLTPSMQEWQIMREQAGALVATGFLPASIKTPEQALAIMLQGRELGIPAMAALGTINVIQGKPTVSPQLMLALIERSGQLETIKIDSTDEGSTVTMKRKSRPAHAETFGKKEASDLKLIEKDNYKKQPRVMFKWRAVAACARVVFPDVVLGLYTPDEMGANTDPETGEAINEPNPVQVFPPTKSELVEAAKKPAAAEKQQIAGKSVEGPQFTGSANPAENAAAMADSMTLEEIDMRGEIITLLKSVGINSGLSVKKFDESPEKREVGYIAVAKTAIKKVIESDRWSYTDEGTNSYLEKFGITEIEKASRGQLAGLIEKMREDGFLDPK